MAIEFSNVWYRYPGSRKWVLSSVDVRFDESRIHVVFGPNGSGKTTLLKIASLIYRPVKGKVFAWGYDYWSLPNSKRIELRRRIVYVHEKPILFKGTVEYNIAYGLMIRGLDRHEALVKARVLLEKLGLSYLADKKTNGLSAGEAQLVAILRAIVLEPRILVLDEPFAHLDSSKRDKIMELVLELRENGTGVVMASHDVFLAKAIAERVIVVENGKVLKPD